jgi:hypothetical protein
MNDFASKRAAKIERLEDRAERARTLAAQIDASAHRRADMIPFGQPILVGHHSEKRDRNFRGRIVRDFGRAVKLREYAAELERRAQASADNPAIFSDDPNAPAKLRDKLEQCEQLQKRMKQLNSAWRRRGADGLRECGLTDAQVASLEQSIEKAYSWEKQPFPGYQLTNNGAEIRRLKARIQEVDVRVANAEKDDEREAFGTASLTLAHADNRVQLRFPGKPDAETIRTLKSHGFRWAPSMGAWQRHLSNAAAHWGREVLKQWQARQLD